MHRERKEIEQKLDGIYHEGAKTQRSTRDFTQRGKGKTRKGRLNYNHSPCAPLRLRVFVVKMGLLHFTVHLVQCFGAVLDVQLVIYLVNVLAHRSGADVELCGDFFIQ